MSTRQLGRIYGHAISNRLRSEGFTKSLSGVGTGFSVEGYDYHVTVHYTHKDSDEAMRQLVEMRDFFNAIPAYRAEIKVPDVMVGISTNLSLEITKPLAEDAPKLSLVTEDAPAAETEHPRIVAPVFRRQEEGLAALRKVLDAAPDDSFYTRLLERESATPGSWDAEPVLSLEVLYLVPREDVLRKIEVYFMEEGQYFWTSITHERFYGVQAAVDHVRFALIES